MAAADPASGSDTSASSSSDGQAQSQAQPEAATVANTSTGGAAAASAGVDPPASPSASSTPAPDKSSQCRRWARAGECQRNPGYMIAQCATSCHKLGCKKAPAVKKKPKPATMPPLSLALSQVLKTSPTGDAAAPPLSAAYSLATWSITMSTLKLSCTHPVAAAPGSSGFHPRLQRDSVAKEINFGVSDAAHSRWSMAYRPYLGAGSMTWKAPSVAVGQRKFALTFKSSFDTGMWYDGRTAASRQAKPKPKPKATPEAKAEKAPPAAAAAGAAAAAAGAVARRPGLPPGEAAATVVTTVGAGHRLAAEVKFKQPPPTQAKKSSVMPPCTLTFTPSESLVSNHAPEAYSNVCFILMECLPPVAGY